MSIYDQIWTMLEHIWSIYGVYMPVYGSLYHQKRAYIGLILAQNDHIFLKWLPGGQKFCVDVFNSKASDLAIVSSIRESLTS